MFASVDPKQCVARNLCGAIYVVQSMWCNLCGALYVGQCIRRAAAEPAAACLDDDALDVVERMPMAAIVPMVMGSVLAIVTMVFAALAGDSGSFEQRAVSAAILLMAAVPAESLTMIAAAWWWPPRARPPRAGRRRRAVLSVLGNPS